MEPITEIQQVIDRVTTGMSTEDYLGLLEDLSEAIQERIGVAERELDGSGT